MYIQFANIIKSTIICKNITINIPGLQQRSDNKDQLKDSDKMTLDVLLNILDGVLTTPGQIMIMTTNHKDVLDKALIRPGRIDISIELSKCNRGMIRELSEIYYRQTLGDNVQKVIEQIPEYEYTPAHVMNVFRRFRDQTLEGVQAIHVESDSIDSEEWNWW